MSLISDFKDFAMKGNVVDMAIGVIIGGAFGKIVTSMVSDIMMPILGYVIGGVNFTDFKLTLKDAVPATDTTPAVPSVCTPKEGGTKVQSFFEATACASLSAATDSVFVLKGYSNGTVSPVIEGAAAKCYTAAAPTANP